MSDRVFIVWRKFQRRVESLAAELEIETHYYHHSWEEKNRLLKALSYIPKCLRTMYDLIRLRPKYIFLQLAPTPILYVAAIYCAFSRAQYIADCHNTMIYDSPWINWPFAKALLRKSKLTIVHNNDVLAKAEALQIEAIVLRDPLPKLSADPAHLPYKQKHQYVIVPCGMADDEPIHELFDAARALPHIQIYMTWFVDRLPQDVRTKTPPNVNFTGYLDEEAFNALFSGAFAALILTTREGTQPSGAAESISLGVPMVLSDLATTRSLYGDAAILIANDGPSIAAGIETALAEPDTYRTAMKELRLRFDREIAVQLDQVRGILSE